MCCNIVKRSLSLKVSSFLDWHVDHCGSSLDSPGFALWQHGARKKPLDLERWNDKECQGSRGWLQCDILAVATALVLVLEVSIPDSLGLEGMLLKARHWKDACLEVDHAS